MVEGELQQIYDKAVEMPLRVRDIFNEFFGEDRVDLHIARLSDVPVRYLNSGALVPSFIRTSDIYILVHFPRVKVTNEFDKFTYVNHLYAKIDIDSAGKLKHKFTLNRAEYTIQHFTNGYMHSHISSIPTDDFTQFQVPCTGSGPINNTICSLIHDFDEDLWRLFCLELDRFVQVESIAGAPYHRLEQLTDRRRESYKLDTRIQYVKNLDCYTLGGHRNIILSMAKIAAFIKYVIDKDVLKFTYIVNKYQPAMSPTEYLVTISNCFIEWYNKEFYEGRVSATYNDFLDKRIIKKCKFINGQLWEDNPYESNLLDYRRHIGKRICTFKGQDVTISFSDDGPGTEQEYFVNILNPKIANYIITKILNVINFRYGNDTENPNEKGVYYL